MSNVLFTKLSRFTDLSEADRLAVDQLCEHRITLDAHQELIGEGERPNDVFLLLEGWGFRYKHLPDGGRHILAYLIPGDLCDIHVFILRAMDHALGLLTPATVAVISQQRMVEAMDSHPKLQRALWWSTLVDEAVLREWLVNIGHRDAVTRIAHLFCELWIRMRAVNLASDGRFSLPITQEDLADTMGLSPVHVNRSLQDLRRRGLISWARRELTIHDPVALMAEADFTANYLHLDPRREPARADN